MSQASRNATARWTTRIIPVLITSAAGYATYVVASHICVDYLYHSKGESGTVIAILVLHFFFLLLTIAAYARTIITIKVDAGLVPLGPQAHEAERQPSKKRRSKRQDDLESQPYYTGPDMNPDSPALENFYTKDVFVCESDGRPRWCSECRTWKPDRSHHSSEIGRCVRKMDHYCPWVGGMVSETSFKFFTQFTFYCTLFCAVALSASSYTLSRQLSDSWPVDGRIVSLMALSGFFGLFTFLMTATSMRFIFLNVTNIDMLKKDWVYQLAVRVPRGTTSTDRFTTITYPLPKGPVPGNQGPNGHTASHSNTGSYYYGNGSASPRDDLATRTFAVVKTEPGENPWDLGWKENWKAVMGTNLFEWALPIRGSPCSIHESPLSEYAMGSLLGVIKKRYGIQELIESHEGLEMGHIDRT